MKFLPVTSNVSTLVRILKPLVLQTSKDRYTHCWFLEWISIFVLNALRCHLKILMFLYFFWYFFKSMLYFVLFLYFRYMDLVNKIIELNLNFWFSAYFCPHGPTWLIVLIFSYSQHFFSRLFFDSWHHILRYSQVLI